VRLTAGPVVLAALVAMLLPARAAAAPCPPRDCGAVATPAAGGALVYEKAALARVFDLTTGKLRAELTGAVLSPDGTVAVAQTGRVLRTYALATGRLLATARIPRGWTLSGVTTNPLRTVLLAGTPTRTLVAVRTGSRQQTLSLPGGFEFEGLFGSRLSLLEQLGNEQQRVRAVDLTTGALLADQSPPVGGRTWARLVSPDGRSVFTVYVGAPDTLHQLDLLTGAQWTVELPSGAIGLHGSWALALSPDRNRLYAAAGGIGAVATVDVASGRVTRIAEVDSWMPVDRAAMASAAVSPDGTTLAFENAGHAWIFDLERNELVKTLDSRVDTVVSFTPAAKLVFVAADGPYRQPT
jgi:DNA-binding beta-propeller fold protein YncE